MYLAAFSVPRVSNVYLFPLIGYYSCVVSVMNANYVSPTTLMPSMSLCFLCIVLLYDKTKYGNKPNPIVHLALPMSSHVIRVVRVLFHISF